MTQLPSERPALFNGRHFNHLLIIQAVRWYVTYKLSYRDVCDLMSERGVTVVHTTVLPFTFLLLTERDIATLISVTKRGYMSKPTDLVQGTLDLLILKILALEPLHGWAIGQRLKQVSCDVLQVRDGSLYPALHKLKQEGWITAEWKTSELGRRAKFYSLTRLGRKQLERQVADWARLSTAITNVVELPELN